MRYSQQQHVFALGYLPAWCTNLTFGNVVKPAAGTSLQPVAKIKTSTSWIFPAHLCRWASDVIVHDRDPSVKVKTNFNYTLYNMVINEMYFACHAHCYEELLLLQMAEASVLQGEWGILIIRRLAFGSSCNHDTPFFNRISIHNQDLLTFYRGFAGWIHILGWMPHDLSKLY